MPETNFAPTVVLVHGAFADAGSWAPVTERLLKAGVKVQALVNPLRSLAGDSAYVASAIAQIPGPVLAVGHSYGGASITNAATTTPNVVGLVFVAGFAPDEGETLAATAAELYVNPALFREVFAGDLPEAQAAVLAASQRPVAAAAFEEKTGEPGWKKLPSWAVVATGDKAAGADVVLMMAKRANADIVELEGSHLIMISQPDAVTDVILGALRSVG